MNLIVGNKYKKSEFDIAGIVLQWSEITVGGELFTFFSKSEKYTNSIEKDGFVYECRGVYGLIPKDTQTSLNRHVFYKENPGSSYTYLGKGTYEIRHDENHNKLFW